MREIKNKVSQYQKTKFSVLELLFCVMGSLGAGVLPLLKLQFRVQTSKSRSVSEVRQFQSILIMERHLHGMTVLGVLEDMEVFAKNFRGILRKCINSYGAGSQRALLQMKEEGSRLQENFEELADAFLSVDEVGIAMAFAEVESNRKLLEKMTQLEAEISMERKKENTELLAKIPMILSVGAYFILPFFIYSLQEEMQ